MNCPKCNSENIIKNGHDPRTGKQKYQCKSCLYAFQRLSEELLSSTTETKETQISQKMGLSESEVRQKHDINYIISTALQTVKPGTFYKKDEILKLAKIRPNMPGVNDVLLINEKYYGRASGNVIYWSHPESIEKLKNEGILS